MVDDGGGRYEWDFLVSYAQADRGWAEWVAWQLTAAGYSVLVQAWHIVAGMSWSERIAAGMARSARTVAVLSPDYVASEACAAEWQAAWRADMQGKGRRLLPVRVAEFSPPPPFDGIVYTDLFGGGESEAASRLSAMVRSAESGRREPTEPPSFPGTAAGGGGPRFPGTAPSVWSMAWPRNPYLTGREEELSLLRARWASNSGAATLPQALHGIGGVGKTQLAVEYAYRHAREYDLVWWVPAEHPTLVVTALAALARRLGVAVRGRAEESARAAVENLRRGARYPHWLVIIDNAGKPGDVHGLLPAAQVGGGHLLVTSRDPGWSRLAQTVEVDVLPHSAAVGLLRARAPRLGEGDAGRVAAAVGCLPLALEQAGAWLAETGIPAGDYVELLRRRVREVMDRGAPPDHAPVAATWTVALDAGNPAAVALARLWAHFGPEPIPTDLVRPDVAGVLPSPLDGAARDPLVFRDLVGWLVRSALVRAVDGDMVVMHRLVQAALDDHTPAGQREGYRRAARRLLAAANPGDPRSPASWPRYRALHPHVAAIRMIDDYDAGSRRLVLDILAYLEACGDLLDFVTLAGETCALWTATLGEEHLDRTRAARALAGARLGLGDYLAARALFEDVVPRLQETLGNDHPETIEATIGLSRTLWWGGDVQAARTLDDDLLPRTRRVFGENDPRTIGVTIDVGHQVWLDGDHVSARAVFEDLLPRCRRVLGDDDPRTIIAAACLARARWSAGDVAEARSVFEEIMPRCRERLAAGDPRIVHAAFIVGDALFGAGLYPEVRTLLGDLLPLSGRTLGTDHPNRIKMQVRLGVSLLALGDYPAARDLLADVLPRSQLAFGEDSYYSTLAQDTLAKAAAALDA